MGTKTVVECNNLKMMIVVVCCVMEKRVKYGDYLLKMIKAKSLRKFEKCGKHVFVI